MVVRRVPPEIPDLDELGLPPQVERFAEEEQGLVLVTGPPGSGKTTTVAAMIDHINDRRACHIVTIEDPIEVLHADARRSSASARSAPTPPATPPRCAAGCARTPT